MLKFKNKFREFVQVSNPTLSYLDRPIEDFLKGSETKQKSVNKP